MWRIRRSDKAHILKYKRETKSVYRLSQLKTCDLPTIVEILMRHRVVGLKSLPIHRYFAPTPSEKTTGLLDVLIQQDSDVAAEFVGEDTVYVFRPISGEANAIVRMTIMSTAVAALKMRSLAKRERVKCFTDGSLITLVGTYDELLRACELLSSLSEPVHDIRLAHALPFDVLLCADSGFRKELEKHAITVSLSESGFDMSLGSDFDLLSGAFAEANFESYARDMIRQYEEICDVSLEPGSLVMVVCLRREIGVPAWLLAFTPLSPKVFWGNARRMKVLMKAANFPREGMWTVFLYVTKEAHTSRDVVRALNVRRDELSSLRMFAFLVE